jgi:hypothetical protein
MMMIFANYLLHEILLTNFEEFLTKKWGKFWIYRYLFSGVKN